MRRLVAPLFVGLASLSFPSFAHADELTRVSLTSAGGEADASSYICSVSADGRYVAFDSAASNLGAPVLFGTNNVFVRDRLTSTTQWLNQPTVLGQPGIGDTLGPNMTPDGRFVVFQSKAHNAFLIGKSVSTEFACFRLDRQTGIVALAQGQPAATNHPYWTSLPTCSDDGRFVAYVGSWDNSPAPAGVVPGIQIYVFDMVAQTTQLVSKNASGVAGNGLSTLPWISGNGRYVAFNSQASNLVPNDTNNAQDIFRVDRLTGVIERVSVSDGEAQANAQSFSEALGYISSDGNFVAFTSFANNLVVGDTNGFRDVFVRDIAAATTRRVSVDSSGAQGNQVSRLGSLSKGGRYVSFTSQSTTFYAGDVNGSNDAFRHDLKTGLTEVLSKPPTGAANASSDFPMTSLDGRFVAFPCLASNLVPGDTNGVYDVFLFRDCWVTLETIGVGTPGNGGFTPVLTGSSGSCDRSGWSIAITNADGPSVGLLFVGTSEFDQSPVFGGHFYVDLTGPVLALPIALAGHGPGTGELAFDVLTDVTAFAGVTLVMQAAIADAAGAGGATLTNGMRAVIE